MSYQFIKYEASDGVGRVLLDRPEKLNALSRELQDELVDCLERADDDPDVRVMTLRGSGRAFCAGYDITPPSTPEAQAAAQRQRDNIRADIHRMKRTPNTMNSILNLSKPVIAGVHGYCIAGGTDLAMHCDIIIAADDAQIGFPPVRSMGTPPTHMWTYMVGPQWAKWFLLTGESVFRKARRGDRTGLEVGARRRPRRGGGRPGDDDGADPVGAAGRQQEHRQQGDGPPWVARRSSTYQPRPTRSRTRRRSSRVLQDGSRGGSQGRAGMARRAVQRLPGPKVIPAPLVTKRTGSCQPISSELDTLTGSWSQ